MRYAAVLRIESLHPESGKPGETMRPGWPVLDADKGKALDDWKRARPRPTRAILIGDSSKPGRAVKRGDHWSLLGRKEKWVALADAFYVVSGLIIPAARTAEKVSRHVSLVSLDS